MIKRTDEYTISVHNKHKLLLRLETISLNYTECKIRFINLTNLKIDYSLKILILLQLYIFITKILELIINTSNH